MADKQERADIEDKQLRNGIRTINEVRASYGYDPVDWGDVPMNYGLANSSLEDMQPANEIKTLKKALLMERLGKEY